MHVAYLTGVYIHQDEPWYLNILCVRVTCKVHKSRKRKWPVTLLEEGADICKRPFLWDGISPVSIDCWKRWANTGPSSVASSFRTLGWSSSGPKACLDSIEKTCLRGLRPSKTQTGLLSYRDQLGFWNFGFSKQRYYTIQAANNKGADRTAWMRRLICAFVVRIWHKQVFSWRDSNVIQKSLQDQNQSPTILSQIKGSRER